jgi:glycosyltransferase involved in cell wall biosynthesis
VKLTAAIIVQEEERNLAELLPRLDGVDEIVVVDGGSTDRTVQIARDHGCRVAVRPLDNFANQRNYACRLATGDWILSIDADERPTPRLLSEIRRVTSASDRAAYRVPIRSTILGRPVRYGGTQDDRPLRLFRRGRACWHGNVHEVLRADGPTGLLDGWLEHYTLPDLDAFLAKVHRYTALEARARVAAGRPPGACDIFLAPVREVFRRLVWKWGLLDGPAGWAFGLLSGLSEWLLALRHRQAWRERQDQAGLVPRHSSTDGSGATASASVCRWTGTGKASGTRPSKTDGTLVTERQGGHSLQGPQVEGPTLTGKAAPTAEPRLVEDAA